MQTFNGTKYYPHSKGYYRTSHSWMHRDVWEHHNGPIPEGMHVHHINGDKADNRLENLELIAASDHSRMHNPVGTKRDQLAIARANRWAAASVQAKCHCCGVEFQARMVTAKWCSSACRSRASRRRLAS